MSYYRTVPTYKQQLVTNAETTPSWYRFWQDTDKGVPPADEVSVPVGPSPFTYTAPRAGSVIVYGGTVVSIEFVRSSVHVTGQTSGMFPVSLGDGITITYSGAPTVTFVPQ